MDNVFALDIGTRVVVGLVMKKNDKGYEIITSARTEHSQRAMYDGQVHDVDEVARAVAKIKEEIEKDTGIKLKKVAVAAAGRALCTLTAKATREESFPINWEKPEVVSLEMEAVQNAMNKISYGEDKGRFHCVGYSTVIQQLEDMPITSLIGQKGRKAGLTVIATFLPRTVVDGLVAVLERVGLEMESLTLEPIAAGQAAIPADMRRLNLALVDIGAGTSDIGLTRDGSFFAYGMVPIAGDEVTEIICSNYLLDFQTSEKIKRQLSAKNGIEIEIVNFFGDKVSVPKEEVFEVIRPTIRKIAERISQEIILLNKNKPQGIILVGGGSLTPLLRDMLAEIIAIPGNRIGIQVRERLNSVFGEEDRLTGSDVITPIGIAMTALNDQGLHYYSVRVNDVNIPIFELQSATVADALLAAGIEPRSFIGRPGAALIYELNGEIRVIKGELGKPAEISVNGQPAKLEHKISAGDVISFLPGYSGKDAKAKIKDIFSLTPTKKIIWNGKEDEVSPSICIDGKEVAVDEWLKDGCKLVIKENKTLYDLLKFKRFSLDRIKKRKIKINGAVKELISNVGIRINGQIINGDYILRNNDRIDITEQKIRIKDLDIVADPMRFSVNGEEFLFPPQNKKVFYKGKELFPDNPVEGDMELRVEGFSRKPILSELFPYLNLKQKAISGGKLEMSVNGRKAEFTTELNQGDRIIIVWVNSEIG